MGELRKIAVFHAALLRERALDLRERFGTFVIERARHRHIGALAQRREPSAKSNKGLILKLDSQFHFSPFDPPGFGRKWEETHKQPSRSQKPITTQAFA
jgi:hypothetical protein